MRIVNSDYSFMSQSSPTSANQNKRTPNFKWFISGVVSDKANGPHLRAGMDLIGDVFSREMGCDIVTQICSDYQVRLGLPQNPRICKVGKRLAAILNEYAEQRQIDARFRCV
jgi:hypothetical protein